MKIDAHQHFWELSRGDYGWLKPTSTLYRDFVPHDLKGHLEARNVERTVVVQAAPTVAETEFLLGLADTEPVIAGVVGWLDFESPNFEQDYRRLRKNKKFVGVRPMLQDLSDDRWILQSDVINKVKLLADESFPIDLLIFPRHLPYILELLQLVPNMHAVIDHLAKPDIANRVIEPWRVHMEEMASYPSVYCKLSGMVTEVNHTAWSPKDFVEFVNHVVQAFGAQRLMFGSDWPVCTQVASYEQVYDMAMELLCHQLSEEQMESVFGQVATGFYGLELE